MNKENELRVGVKCFNVPVKGDDGNAAVLHLDLDMLEAEKRRQRPHCVRTETERK